jgi:hypothetical protein
MSNKSRLRELREELHYYQEMVRVDIRAVRAGMRKCKEIGAKMIDLQPRPTPQLRPADWRPQVIIESESKQIEML